jgi:hypothetical protein
MFVLEAMPLMDEVPLDFEAAEVDPDDPDEPDIDMPGIEPDDEEVVVDDG